MAVDLILLRKSIGLGYITNCLSELTFTSVLFPMLSLNNWSLWFLSASVIAGGLVVFLLCKYKDKLIIFILPIVVFTYNSFINYYGTIDVWHNLLGDVVQIAFFRAFAGILLGVLSCYIISRITVSIDTFIHKALVVISVVFICFCCMYYAMFHRNEYYDIYFLVLFFILIFVSNLSDFFTDKAVVKMIDNLTMPMYIFQMISINIVRCFCGNITRIFLSLMLDLCISIMWVCINKYIVSQYKKRRRGITTK